MRKLILTAIVFVAYLTAAITAGTYKGTWSGGGSGDFKLTLSQPEAGQWKADVTFTLQDTEVPTKVTSVKVDGNKLSVVYQFALQGTQLQSAIQGELKDSTMEGTYKTTTVPDNAAVDEGTWKVSVQ